MKSHMVVIFTLLGVACGPTGDAGTRERTDSAPGSGMPAMAGMDTEPEMAGRPGMQMTGAEPIHITSRQAALAGVTFAVATEAPLEQTVRAVAMVVPNERGLGIVNARVSGWVEKLYVNETGLHVEAGAPLFDLYAPDLVTAQEELFLAKTLANASGGDSLVTSARRRLALWGISEQTIADIEETGTVRRRLTITSPYPGHVLEKHVIEGQMVHVGERLFKVADLSTVWIEPAIFEQDIALVRERQRADVTLDAVPDAQFVGRVTFIHPTLDMRTRTLRVRVEVPNPTGRIRPMMYGTVRIHTTGRRGVTVPLTAVLPTGSRNLAFVVREGAVVPTDVTVGARGDSTILVANGLTAGDTVVASATFLFDSESSLAAAMAGLMLNMGMGLDMGGMDMGGMQMDMPDSGSTGMSRDSMPNMPADTGRRR